MKAIALALISAYQLILSPLLGGSCRFCPSCSNYARESVSRFGAARGLILATWRILRCNPFVPGGLDPPPHEFDLRAAPFRKGDSAAGHISGAGGRCNS